MRYFNLKNSVKLLLFYVLVIPFILGLALIKMPQLSALSIENDPNYKILQKELKLNIDLVTDDPDPTITFVKPKDLVIKIDEDKELENPTSPLRLPKLDFGPHTLTFSYISPEGVSRNLSITVIVVPKPPVISTQKTLFYKPEVLKIEGTALPNADVMLVINSEDIKYVPVSKDGKWEIVLETTKLGTYNIMAFTYKNGIISKTPAQITLEYRLKKEPSGAVTTSTNESEYQSIIEKVKTKAAWAQQLLKSNPKYLWGAIAFGSGVFILILGFYIHRSIKRKLEDKTLAELLGGIDTPITELLNGKEEQASTGKDTTKVTNAAESKETTESQSKKTKSKAKKTKRSKPKKTKVSKPQTKQKAPNDTEVVVKKGKKLEI